MSYIQTKFSFENQHIVITGGAGVLAQSLAIGYLLSHGNVSLWGRSQATLEQSQKEILADNSIPEQALHTYEVDCTDKQGLIDAFEETEKQHGMPTVLVNCVGGNKGKGPFLEQDEEAFKDVLHLNLVAGLLLPSQIFGQKWKDHNINGNIINFSSMAAYHCISGVWSYAAAKTAVLHLTKGMARELAPYNIRVNSISPGFFLGKQNKAFLVEKDTPYTLTARGKQVIDKTPMKRFGNDKDLQGAALFLASNQAAEFVTGIDIPVDGGFLTDSL